MYRIIPDITLAKCYAADSAAVEDIVSDSLVALMEKIDLLRTLTEAQERAYVLAVVRLSLIHI